MKISIKNGQMSFVAGEGTEELQSLGTVTKRRVSHVEPVNPVQRRLFHFIRSRVSDDSRIAGWTRRWSCLWRARLFDGPTLGPFRDRQAAIDAEVAWLEEGRGA